MPKDHRKRTVVHMPSARLQGHSVTSTGLPESKLKKKDKQQSKHETFMQRLELSHQPYSKSHARRLKRKAKEQVANGMTEIQDALPSLDEDETNNDAAKNTDDQRPQEKARGGQIGKGKGPTLTSAQRKRALKLEQLRHPLILTNSKFATNPFETIRTHAQNTLLQRAAPS
ncbi:ribosome biogenesis protein SLX9-domain-containing protein [Desarmillaria tabescens]|uniref:Ribosome biogenesis protein SLX9 n=1 Tax=Armillaria tabescens TaxID=1929756 RepID=A0AA39TWB1_ARMTA|nr:ribosome biogenesis protein SLX9-domain-containing protein [Desarmillaria tabescens]KAK0465194.1 ribosome biogenesis protein SLX9-domain-containing protein [Desarmillaria tabescens]